MLIKYGIICRIEGDSNMRIYMIYFLFLFCCYSGNREINTSTDQPFQPIQNLRNDGFDESLLPPWAGIKIEDRDNNEKFLVITVKNQKIEGLPVLAEIIPALNLQNSIIIGLRIIATNSFDIAGINYFSNLKSLHISLNGDLQNMDQIEESLVEYLFLEGDITNYPNFGKMTEVVDIRIKNTKNVQAIEKIIQSTPQNLKIVWILDPNRFINTEIIDQLSSYLNGKSIIFQADIGEYRD